MQVTIDLTATDLAALLAGGARVNLTAPDPARAPVPAWSADLGAVPELDEIGVFAPNADPAAVVGLVSYYLRGPLAMAGEWMEEWAEVERGGLVRFPLDITKSRRDDAYGELSDPATGLAAWLRDGSPVRKTDRSGPGTRGTRAWDGLPGPVLLLWR